MTPFITGSRAYGYPTPDSDIDLVLPVLDEQESDLLLHLSDKSKCPIKYNKLNLIICTLPGQYELWKNGTEYLKSIAPVTREFAIDYFNNLFEVAGLPKSLGDSGDSPIK